MTRSDLRFPSIPGARLLAWVLLLATLLPGLAAAQSSEDGLEWPQVIEVEQGTIVLYQPQVDSVNENQLEGRCAVAVTVKGAEGPTFGAIWFRCRLETNRETRMSTLVAMEVLDSKFTELSSEQIADLSAFLELTIPGWGVQLSLDRLLAVMDATGDNPQGDKDLKHDPPEIIYRSEPAVLVLIDGDPILSEMDGYELQLLVNSAYFIVFEPTQRMYYLHGGENWYASSDLFGRWIPAPDLPSEVQRVNKAIQEEAAQNQAAAAAAEGSSSDTAAPTDASAADDTAALPSVPGQVEVVVRSHPAELIVSDGAADFATLEGTSLLYLRNSESDILMDITDQHYYLLISGRWYRSKSLEKGPWEFVPFEELPADFAEIPDDSDMGSVRASVPGTTESREALLDNTIPQTAQVDRKTATCTVQYDGSPQFEACGGGEVHHAINCDKTVLRIDGIYYCCDEAVWFVSESPEGAWAVATELPAAIQSLPPECPAYNTKYVYVYDSTPDVVYVGYTPAYYGSYIYGPCVVYGTGWYYHPWYHHYYYPRPVTYGFGVHYNPWTGWGFTFGVSYGWVNIHVGRPAYGGWWGGGGYRYGYRHGYAHGAHAGYHHGYNQGYKQGVRAGYAAGNRSSNAYQNRATGIATTQDRPVARPEASTRPSTADRGSAASRDVARDNVYTDRDGNVYRREGDTWEKREGNDWKDADLGASDRATRDADRSASDGDRSTRDADRTQGAAQQDRSAPDRGSSGAGTADRSQGASQQDRSAPNRGSSGSGSADRSQGASQQNRSTQNQQKSREQQLNRDYQSRERGAQRSQQYQSQRSGGGAGRSGGGGRRR